MSLIKLIGSYKSAIYEMVRAGNELGDEVVKLLKPIIPDLEYAVGCREGINTVCFWSGSKRNRAGKSVDLIDLAAILNNYFPGQHFSTLHGVYVTPQEEKEIRNIIIQNAK